MIKKLAITGMAALLLFLTTTPTRAEVFQPQGKAALLLNGATGQILYQHNGKVKNFPASTTKLLTALVAVEHGKLDQVIKVSATAVDQPWDSSSCYLEAGEEQRLEHLLFGLLLASGNDCAIAIAEGVAGGKSEQFMVWMNETAARLGATSSHFTNPHGLHEPNHYTTALDLALIARGALTNKEVRRIAATREFNWPGKSERNGTYYNHNQMLFTYPGTVGGKTGYTEEAGLTLVSSADKDGLFLIGIVMGEPNKTLQYRDMTALLDLGFENFMPKQIVKAGTSFGTVPVTKGQVGSVTAVAKADFTATAPRNGPSKVTATPRLGAELTAPVTKGQPVGVLEIREESQLLATIPLVSAADAEAKAIDTEVLLAGGLTTLKWIAYVLGGLLLFRTTVKTTRRFIRRSRKRPLDGFSSSGNRNRGTFDMYRTRNR